MFNDVGKFQLRESLVTVISLSFYNGALTSTDCKVANILVIWPIHSAFPTFPPTLHQGRPLVSGGMMECVVEV